MAWVLIPCLKTLFAEFDTIAPDRDHASDGSVGDDSHAAATSDHNPDETGNVPQHDADSTNEVHAIDVDHDLRAPFNMEAVIQFLLAECRKNNPNGTDRGRLKYMIYNRRIWKATNGWKQESYTGSNPHTAHAHFSAEYATSYESDTSTWGLIDRFGDTMPSADEIAKETAAEFRQTPLTLSEQQTGHISTTTSDATIAKLTPILDQLLAFAAGEAAEIVPTVDQISAGVLSALSGLPTAQEKAILLQQLLADDAVTVGRILAGLS